MSHLEDKLAFQIKCFNLPLPERQVSIVPGRKFKHDFVWREYELAVEVNGGTYVTSGHSTGNGLHRDYEKMNLTALEGWQTMTFDKRMIDDGSAVKLLAEFFKRWEKVLYISSGE